jgi:predicted neuraminidase
MMPTVLATLLAASAVVTSEMIFEDAPHPSCHASTIVWTETGLVAAWFGGTDEGEDDVGVWLSRHGPDGWSSPREVLSQILGVALPGIRASETSGRRFPDLRTL